MNYDNETKNVFIFTNLSYAYYVLLAIYRVRAREEIAPDENFRTGRKYLN